MIIRVLNVSSKNVGLGKFCPDLEISETFVIGLEVSFSGDLHLGVSNFETRVSNLPFYTPNARPYNGNLRHTLLHLLERVMF